MPSPRGKEPSPRGKKPIGFGRDEALSHAEASKEPLVLAEAAEASSSSEGAHESSLPALLINVYVPRTRGYSTCITDTKGRAGTRSVSRTGIAGLRSRLSVQTI